MTRSWSLISHLSVSNQTFHDPTHNYAFPNITLRQCSALHWFLHLQEGRNMKCELHRRKIEQSANREAKETRDGKTEMKGTMSENQSYETTTLQYRMRGIENRGWKPGEWHELCNSFGKNECENSFFVVNVTDFDWKWATFINFYDEKLTKNIKDLEIERMSAKIGTAFPLQLLLPRSLSAVCSLFFYFAATSHNRLAQFSLSANPLRQCNATNKSTNWANKKSNQIKRVKKRMMSIKWINLWKKKKDARGKEEKTSLES